MALMTTEQMSASLGSRSHPGSAGTGDRDKGGGRRVLLTTRGSAEAPGEDNATSSGCLGKGLGCCLPGMGAGLLWVLSRQLSGENIRKEAKPLTACVVTGR